VHDAGIQHANDFADETAMQVDRHLRRDLYVIQARRGVALVVGDELHQQHAGVEIVGAGHPHSGGGETKERAHFRALPRLLLRLAPEARALRDGARLAAVLGLAVLGVVDGLAETALVGFFVDLGTSRLRAAAHHKDHRLLAAHELTHDRVDHTVVDKRLQPLRDFHAPQYTLQRQLPGRISPHLMLRVAAR
jgi:hypothetical protein